MESKIKECKSMKKSHEEREQVKQLFGYIPKLNVEENGQIIGTVEVNANLSVGYLEDSFFESEGITKLENGKIVYIEHVVGMIDTKVITKMETLELIQKNQAYHLVAKLGLESEFTVKQQHEISEPMNPRIYEVKVYTG